MGEEYLRVLRMVAEGKVSPEDAVGLLEALEPAGGSADKLPTMPMPPMPAMPPMPPAPTMLAVAAVPPAPPARRVRIHLETAEGSEFNLYHPIGTSRHVAGVLPERARKAIADFGVDIEAFLAHLERDTPSGELLAVEMSEGGELKITLE